MRVDLMTFQQWVNEVSLAATGHVYIPGNTGRHDWREEARRISDDPAFRDANPPAPDLYDNWASWAISFQDAVRNIT